MGRTATSELTAEEDTEQAAVVSQVNTWCKLSEASADLNDDYEKERFEELITKSKNSLPKLTDPFYAGAARHSIINALCRARRQSEALSFFAEIEEDFIVEKVLEDNPSLANDPAVVSRLNFRHLLDFMKDIRSAVAELSSRDPVDLAAIEARLAALESELGQGISSNSAIIKQYSKRLTTVLWLLIVVLLLVLFK